jgi:hypothetical protein
MFLKTPLPIEQLKKLEFLLGSYEGHELVFPPDGREPLTLEVDASGFYEQSERFVKFEFFGRTGKEIFDSFLCLITYNTEHSCYRSWIFSRSQEEPMLLSGDFEDGALVFTSEVTEMLWGSQMLKFKIAPLDGQRIEIFGSYWTPDGYQRYCEAILTPSNVPIL